MCTLETCTFHDFQGLGAIGIWLPLLPCGESLQLARQWFRPRLHMPGKRDWSLEINSPRSASNCNGRAIPKALSSLVAGAVRWYLNDRDTWGRLRTPKLRQGEHPNVRKLCVFKSAALKEAHLLRQTLCFWLDMFVYARCKRHSPWRLSGKGTQLLCGSEQHCLAGGSIQPGQVDASDSATYQWEFCLTSHQDCQPVRKDAFPVVEDQDHSPGELRPHALGLTSERTSPERVSLRIRRSESLLNGSPCQSPSHRHWACSNLGPGLKRQPRFCSERCWPWCC